MDREKYISLVEKALGEMLPKEDARPADLSAAMRYGVGSGGKRIRPVVCFGAAEAAGGMAEDAAFPAAAIEIIHNYTLIHDDLPAMDNDVERRGKPTVWKKFGEANAILAGDAMIPLAFAAALKAPRNGAEVARSLARAAYGVVCGQVEDVAEGKDAAYVYEHKTADLFIAAAEMGALAAGADPATVEKLRLFALNLGLAFQYEDDLLDGDGLCPPEETKRLAEETTAAALAALEGLPGDATLLRETATLLLGRKI